MRTWIDITIFNLETIQHWFNVYQKTLDTHNEKLRIEDNETLTKLSAALISAREHDEDCCSHQVYFKTKGGV